MGTADAAKKVSSICIITWHPLKYSTFYLIADAAFLILSYMSVSFGDLPASFLQNA